MSVPIWFISDPHFNHANMVRGGKIANRSQFDTVEQMNDCIVTGINRVVEPHHKLYILGDITLDRRDESVLAGFVRQLHGHKRLIPGNHDHFDWQAYVRAGFEKVLAMRVMANIVFTHIPVHPNQFTRFTGNVHGHVHDNHVSRTVTTSKTCYGGHYGEEQYEQLVGREERDTRYLNVCVEAVGYAPVSLDQIVEYYRQMKETL